MLTWVVGCAKEEAPPGALPDQRPPGVREIVPEPGSVVSDFDGELRVRFDEPIEQPGSGYGREMEASPAYRYRVTSNFSEVRVRPEEGWRTGAVYVFRFPGGIRDLLGNQREEPIDVVFSTGPEVTETRVSGRVRDRVTGEGVRDARVLFLTEEGDSIPYTTVSDTGGVFSLRSLPPGRYTAYGFEDLNASLSLDRRLEPYDSATFRLEGASASAEVDFRMTPPDSTPPVLARAEAPDSLTVLLVFDDPLEPGQAFEDADVAVRPIDREETIPVERIGLTPPAPAQPAAEPDTVPPDSVPGDSLRAPPDPEAAPGPEVPDPEAAPAVAEDTLPLPSDSLYLRLGRPLEPDRTYRASASGLLNLQGLAGGGDTTFVYTPPDTAGAEGEEAPADSVAPADTAAVEADSAAAEADTTVAADADSAAVGAGAPARAPPVGRRGGPG